MSSSPGPLGTVALYIDSAGVALARVAAESRGIPIVGEVISLWLYKVANFIVWAAYYLNEADSRIESFSWEEFTDNFRKWIMKFLGAYPWDFIIFDDDLFGFCLHRMGLPEYEAKMASYDLPTYLRWRMIVWWGFLERIALDAAGWIKDQIIDRWPILEGFFEDPIAWVMYRLGADMWQVLAFRDDIPAWIFYRLTGSYVDALFYKWNLIEYVKWKLRTHWPFIDELLIDPVGWLWYNLRDAIDRYIDTQIEWVIQTSARVINLIWQARV